MAARRCRASTELVARDPGAYWDTSTNSVNGSAFGNHSPRMFPIPLYDPPFYDSGKRNGRDADSQDRELDRLLRRGRRRQGRDRPHHPDRRHSRQERPCAGRGASQNDSADSVTTSMAQLAASIISHDDEFKRQLAAMLRACGVPVGIVEERRSGTEAAGPDLVVVDIRGDASSGMAAIERMRAGHPGVALFAVAAAAEPDLILQAMRAGANEFFPWNAGGATQASRAMEESFHGAVRRTAARREAVTAGARQPCVTHVFLGAKGGSGTTTVAVNCAVELARLSKRPTAILDLKPCLGEVALFLGVRPRFTVLDAIENLHRLDREFLSELMSRHKSGLDILAASEQFDRPERTGCRGD